jgi:hypothetical protein
MPGFTDRHLYSARAEYAAYDVGQRHERRTFSARESIGEKAQNGSGVLHTLGFDD